MSDAFGVVAIVAMMPLISIQAVGIIYEHKDKRTSVTAEYGDYDIVELWEEDAA